MPSYTRERFEELVGEALDELPEWVVRAMDNVQVFVEDFPPPDEPNLLGRYHGVPLSARGSHYTNALPDSITLYGVTIVAVAGHDEVALKRQIARTVAHEIAHHFGISDDRLREIDAY
jgi:predicted Zn-dependent protease with MMP-like domain